MLFRSVILRAYDYDFFTQENNPLAKVALVSDDNGYASIIAKEKASTIGILQEDVSKVMKNDGIVLIEASYIPPDIISKKMQECKVPSGPMYYRTSRGSEPELNHGLNFCLEIIELNSSSLIYGGSIDLGDADRDTIISITKKEIDEIIGANINRKSVV